MAQKKRQKISTKAQDLQGGYIKIFEFGNAWVRADCIYYPNTLNV